MKDLKERQNLLDRAKAKVIWGHGREEARAYLRKAGLEDIEIEPSLDQFVAERRSIIRKTGIRDLIIGVTLLAIGIGMLLMEADRAAGQFGSSGRTRGAFAVPLGFGLWRTITGLFRIFSPGKEEGSVVKTA